MSQTRVRTVLAGTPAIRSPHVAGSRIPFPILTFPWCSPGQSQQPRRREQLWSSHFPASREDAPGEGGSSPCTSYSSGRLVCSISGFIQAAMTLL